MTKFGPLFVKTKISEYKGICSHSLTLTSFHSMYVCTYVVNNVLINQDKMHL